MNRREYLGLLTGGSVALAGCPDADTDPETTSPPLETETSLSASPQTEATTRDGDDDPQNMAAVTESIDEFPSPMAVDRTNPFVYINDIPLDNFNGELALAMGSNSDGIDLRGYLQEFPRVPWWESDQKYRRIKNRYVEHHQITRDKAKQSGLSDLPPAEYGLYQRHKRPESATIEDTEPFGSSATETIIEAASDATTETPLVIATGGPLCTIADAYLTDPSIQDKVVVFCRIGENVDTWNAFLSGWSLLVVTQRLQTVFCPAHGGPLIQRSRIEQELPDEPLKTYILEKVYEGTGENPLADGKKWEGDVVSMLSAAHPSTRTEPRNLRFAGLKRHWALGRVLPSFDATTEPTLTKIIDNHVHGQMNEAWWGHMTSPSTWK